MALTSGTKLGPYEILAAVGAGGMGEVYRARDTRLGRECAMKILPTHLSDNPEAKQRFEREARAISSLNHPNICTLYDVGHQDGVEFLVMEFLEGETLANRLAKGPLPPDQVLKHGVEICEGLEKAHKTGVVHRDLKPGNIMLTKTGAKLMDFGLAKATMASVQPLSSLAMTLSGLAAEQPLTAQGMIVGTFQYMAPEQLEGKDADVRSDIFALGTVLYEMVTGRRAFEGRTTASTIAAILASEPKPISSMQPTTPPALDRVVTTSLAKDPDERFQTVHDLKVQLKWIAETAPPTAPLTGRPLRERWAWISVVVILAAALLALYSRMSPNVSQPTLSYILAPEQTSLAYFTGPVTVSHDGRTLAFVATTSAGKDVVWVRPLDASEARALVGTEGASSPFWSADDRSIGFFAGGKLRTIEAVGGPVVTICDAPGPRGGTWNQNGVILFATTWSGIYRVPSSGGTPAEVTKPDASHGETTHRWPYFLPDGQHFLYFAGAITASLHVAALDSGDTKLLFPVRSNAAYTSGYVLYVRDRMLMAQGFDEKKLQLKGQAFPVAGQVLYDQLLWRGVFSCSSNGILAYQGATNGADSRLIMFDRAGKEIKTVGTPGDLIAHSISPDGQRLAVAVLDSSVANYKLWIYDLFREKQTRLTFGTNRDSYPIWAPDGKSVVFGSIKKGPYDIFEKRSDTTGSEELALQSVAAKYPTDVSPDGRFLAYTSTTPGNSKAAVWILPRFGERKPYIFLQGDFNIGEGHFSPDGHWLAYSSDETGRSEIYVTPFPGGGSKWQVSAAGGSGPRWRRDGKELFYMAADSTLIAAEVDTSGSVFQVGALRLLFHLVMRTGVTRLDLSGVVAYDAAPDGKWFVVNSPPPGNPPPITLITNWTPKPGK